MKVPFVLATGFSALVVLSSTSVAQPEAVAPGTQILRACAATYKSLREFKGRASVVSHSAFQTGKEAPEIGLSNADASFDFVRDKSFDISGHDTDHIPFKISSTPQKTTETWQFGKDKGQETRIAKDVEMAVAGFTGVAATAPTTIPALLLDSNWGFPFSRRDEATLKGSEMFGGRLCYVLVQTNKRLSETTTFWIDSKTCLLRGMREVQSEHTFEALTEQEKQEPQTKVLFSDDMHVLSIEKTVPGEAELESAVKKTVNIPNADALATKP